MSWRGKTWRPMTEEGAREADWTPKAVSDEHWMTLPVSEFEELSRKARIHDEALKKYHQLKAEYGAHEQQLQDELEAMTQALESVAWIAHRPAKPTNALDGILHIATSTLSRVSRSEPAPPEGSIFAEGDARCGSKHTETTAVCLLPAGHDGPHRNTQGYWSPLFSSAPPVPEEQQ